MHVLEFLFQAHPLHVVCSLFHLLRDTGHMGAFRLQCWCCRLNDVVPTIHTNQIPVVRASGNNWVMKAEPS